MGTRPRLLPRPLRALQRHPGRAAPSPVSARAGARRMSPPSPRKVLMTADTIGGVWTFAIELCAGLAKHGVDVTLLSMGRLPDEAQRAEAEAQPNLRLVSTAHRLEWMSNCESDVMDSGRTLLELAHECRPDVVHVNGYYHASLPFDAPVVLTAHSCVASWWR